MERSSPFGYAKMTVLNSQQLIREKRVMTLHEKIAESYLHFQLKENIQDMFVFFFLGFLLKIVFDR